MRALALLLLVAACQETPPADEEFATFPPGASAEGLLKAIDGRPEVKEGLRTPGHGSVYFVVLRDGERHGPAYRQASFHVVIGAGVTMPAGAIAIRRVWAASGQIDGANEQPERLGVSVVVEPGAARPYAEAIREAAATFVEALSSRVPLHPDCVLAMGEIAYTNEHAADKAERELAKAARERVPVPAPDGKVVIRSGGREIPVDIELRSQKVGGRSSDGIEVGMMFRTKFDGLNRGMLFEYAHADSRHFWMRNCPIPIDVAYINRGRVEEIFEMEPGFGLPREDPRYYEGSTVADLALEMPAGWFKKNGVKPGDEVLLQIPGRPKPP
ncbi:MAG: DUF192 domain-containing protein [Planctomycetota bacterium]